MKLCRKAQDVAFEAIKDMEDMDRREWLSSVTDVLSKQDCKPFLD